MKKEFCILFTIFCMYFANGQEQSSSIKLSLGASFFSLNESFDDLFFFNNSSPLYVGIVIHDSYRIESISIQYLHYT